MESARNKQLFLAWCANSDPGPLTSQEEQLFRGLMEKWLVEGSQGSPLTQFDLGVKYAAGTFVAPDLEKAVYWLSRSAEQQDSDALANLGLFYFCGVGVANSAETALSLISRSAELGNFVAQFYAGWMHKNGVGTSQNLQHAFKWFHLAALNPKTDGVIISPKTNEASILQTALPRTNPQEMKAIAHFEVGWAFHKGTTGPADVQLAEKWYLAAARQGHAMAQNELGMLCAYGRPEKRMPEAVQWWRKAADEGVTQAALNLAIAYACGDGIPKDSERAKLWARKAADMGNPDANLLLGNLESETLPLRSGDLLRAIDYYRKAAIVGCLGAQHNLGLAYQRLALTNQRELDSALAGSPEVAGSARYFWFDTEKMRMRIIMDSPEHIAEFIQQFDSSEFPPLFDECIDEALLWFWLASENGSAEAKSAATDLENVFEKSKLDSLRSRYAKFRSDFSFELSRAADN